MQDLIIELKTLRNTLNKAIYELKERGQAKALAEKNYRIGLQKKILEERADKTPVTIINDICRGDEKIAELKLQRDIADSLYTSAYEKIHATKLELRIVENQLNAERRGE